MSSELSFSGSGEMDEDQASAILVIDVITTAIMLLSGWVVFTIKTTTCSLLTYWYPGWLLQ